MRYATKSRAAFGPLPVLCLAVLVAGCRKADTAAQQSPPGVPAAVQARADNTVHETISGDINPALTQQLQMFVQQNGHPPATFAEFAAARLDSIPRPPAGKKWAIETSTLQIKAADAP